MIKNDTTLRYGLLVLGTLFCIVSCTAEHGTAQLRDGTKEPTQKKHAEKLDAKAVILLDAELNPTIVTADGTKVPACDGECTTINDNVIPKNVRVEEIHAITVLHSRKNPCCITISQDNVPVEICYACAENYPVVTPGQIFSVAENSANSIAVGTVEATDDDDGTVFSAYTITGGTGETAFALDVVNGTLSVLDSAQLDFETTPSFALTVTVSDGTYTSAAETVTVNLNTAPTITKGFAPSPIPSGGTSTITFTLGNPNAGALTGANFTDPYPAGMVNTTPLLVMGTCANVVTTAVAGGSSFDVTAGDIPAGPGGSCTITVDITATGTGTNPTSVLSTNEAPDSTSGGSDTLAVQ